MQDDVSLSGKNKTGISGISDVADRGLMTDLSRVVGCFVGKNRSERKRQRIREELIREYINSESEDTPSLVLQIFRLFRRD